MQYGESHTAYMPYNEIYGVIVARKSTVVTYTTPPHRIDFRGNSVQNRGIE